MKALHRHHPELPVILVTAMMCSAEYTAHLGARGFLSKPFTTGELLAVIQHVLADSTSRLPERSPIRSERRNRWHSPRWIEYRPRYLAPAGRAMRGRGAAAELARCSPCNPLVRLGTASTTNVQSGPPFQSTGLIGVAAGSMNSSFASSRPA